VACSSRRVADDSSIVLRVFTKGRLQSGTKNFHNSLSKERGDALRADHSSGPVLGANARMSCQVKISRSAFERLPVYLEIRTPKPYLVATVPHCGPNLAGAQLAPLRVTPMHPIMCECAQTCDLRTPNHRPQGLACLHRGNGAKHGQKHSRDPSGLRFAPAERPWKPACYMETRPALKGITWAGAPDESDTPTTTLERDMGAPTTTLGRDRGRPPRRSGETGGRPRG
jgi:hypothetical protein